MAGKPVIYWDSCIFIAWLKDEKRPDPKDMDGVTFLVEEWDAGRLGIVTSTITRVEVLDSYLTKEQRSAFEACLRRSTMSVDGVTSTIAQIAHDIRDAYEEPRVATPDAIHLATAIAAGCDRFFTFDGQASKRRGARTILPLGPTIAGRNLQTLVPRRPATSQGTLPLSPRVRSAQPPPR